MLTTQANGLVMSSCLTDLPDDLCKNASSTPDNGDSITQPYFKISKFIIDTL